MKVAIIADTHWGVRGDSPAHLEHMVTYFRDHFFPEIKRRGVEGIFHLGDLVDRRKYVNFKTAETLRREYLERVAREGLWQDVLCGNHDASYRNTNEVNALRELVGNRYPETRIYTNPTDVERGGLRFLLVPWICQANERDAMDAAAGSNAPYCLGHLELAGFKMYRSSQDSHGLDPSVFKRFDTVLSGHYHHRSSRGNVLYVGAPYEMTWADHEDERGFHVLDTVSLDLEYVRNPLSLHEKVHYDEGSFREYDMEAMQGKIVKVIVKNREDGLKFDRFMRELEGSSPSDIQVVEDHLHVDMIVPEDEAEVASVEDTPVLLRRAVAEMEGVDQQALTGLLMDVYAEAVNRR